MSDCLAFIPMASPTDIRTCYHSVCPLSENSSTVNVPAWVFPSFLLCLDARGKSRLIRSQVVLNVLVVFCWDPLFQLQPVWIDTVNVSQ